MSMNKFDKYMNDPSIANEPMPLREVHAIRLMIYDETKDMTPSEFRAYYAEGFAEIQKKYNFRVVSNGQ